MPSNQINPTISDYKKKWYAKNRERILTSRKEYREYNKESISDYMIEYQKANKDSLSTYKKDWYKKNRVKRLSLMKEYSKKNRNNINEYTNQRFKNDNLFKITVILRSCVNRYLKKNGNYVKKPKNLEILGCSFKELKILIESKFESWMNWENHGKYNGELNYGWDIDHIIPLSSAKTEEELLKLFHYTNLQPLCSKTNRYIKKDNIL